MATVRERLENTDALPACVRDLAAKCLADQGLMNLLMAYEPWFEYMRTESDDRRPQKIMGDMCGRDDDDMFIFQCVDTVDDREEAIFPLPIPDVDKFDGLFSELEDVLKFVQLLQCLFNIFEKNVLYEVKTREIFFRHRRVVNGSWLDVLKDSEFLADIRHLEFSEDAVSERDNISIVFNDDNILCRLVITASYVPISAT